MLEIKTTPPHDIMGQPIKAYLPAGPQSDLLLKIMEKSEKILGSHQINKIREIRRRKSGQYDLAMGTGRPS